MKFLGFGEIFQGAERANLSNYNCINTANYLHFSNEYIVIERAPVTNSFTK